LDEMPHGSSSIGSSLFEFMEESGQEPKVNELLGMVL
jgi:hypothetical protein